MIPPMTITIYRTGHRWDRPIWTCYGPGAQGCALDPWGALADMLATWSRRGQPSAGPDPEKPSGPDWIVTAIRPRLDAGRRAIWIDGENLNHAIGHRSFIWGLDDVGHLSDPRFEILPTCEIDPAVIR